MFICAIRDVADYFNHFPSTLFCLASESVCGKKRRNFLSALSLRLLARTKSLVELSFHECLRCSVSVILFPQQSDVYPIKKSLIFFVSFVSLLTVQWILYRFMQWWNFYYHVILYVIRLNSARTNSLLYTKRICLLRGKKFCVQFNTLYVSQTVIQTFAIEKLYNRTLFCISLVRETDIKVKLS